MWNQEQSGLTSDHIRADNVRDLVMARLGASSRSTASVGQMIVGLEYVTSKMQASGAESVVDYNLLSSNLSIPGRLRCMEEVEELAELLGRETPTEVRTLLTH